MPEGNCGFVEKIVVKDSRGVLVTSGARVRSYARMEDAKQSAAHMTKKYGGKYRATTVSFYVD